MDFMGNLLHLEFCARGCQMRPHPQAQNSKWNPMCFSFGVLCLVMLNELTSPGTKLQMKSALGFIWSFVSGDVGGEAHNSKWASHIPRHKTPNVKVTYLQIKSALGVSVGMCISWAHVAEFPRILFYRKNDLESMSKTRTANWPITPPRNRDYNFRLREQKIHFRVIISKRKCKTLT